MDNELSDLGYVSSAPLLVDDEDETPLHDEANLATLGEVLKLIRSRRRFYQTIDSLTDDKDGLALRSQLAVNKRMLIHLQELEGMVMKAINKVKERQDG